jgi:MoxR-like ATPase
VSPPGVPPPAPSSEHELKTLVLSRHPAIVLETEEEDRADALVAAVAGELGLTRFEWTVTQGLQRLPGATPVYGTEDPLKLLLTLRDLTVEGIYVLKDFAANLAQPPVSRAFRELLERFAAPGRLSTVVITGASVELPAEVEPHAVRYELSLPAADEYRHVIAAVIESLQAERRADVQVGEADIEQFAAALRGLTLNQARQAVAHVAIDDGRLDAADLPRLVERKAQALRDDSLLEFFPPADNGSRLGGFGNLQRWLERARVGFSDEAEQLGLQAPKGLLLVGVQGCGKSLAAKVIARQWDLPLLKLDAGRLYDKYVGESERNLRKAISTAEGMAPVVLWIDEIEKGLAPGGSGDADGGLSRRMFGTFLTWLQEKREEVFVVATANDLSALPPELLRKGRFDEIFFVDLPDAAERAEVLRIHLEMRRQDPATIDVEQVAQATEGFSGAELEQAVVAALLHALQEKRSLNTAILLEEAKATVPLSVSRAEDVARLRDFARERFVPVR